MTLKQKITESLKNKPKMSEDRGSSGSAFKLFMSSIAPGQTIDLRPLPAFKERCLRTPTDMSVHTAVIFQPPNGKKESISFLSREAHYNEDEAPSIMDALKYKATELGLMKQSYNESTDEIKCSFDHPSKEVQECLRSLFFPWRKFSIPVLANASAVEVGTKASKDNTYKVYNFINGNLQNPEDWIVADFSLDRQIESLEGHLSELSKKKMKFSSLEESSLISVHRVANPSRGQAHFNVKFKEGGGPVLSKDFFSKIKATSYPNVNPQVAKLTKEHDEIVTIISGCVFWKAVASVYPELDNFLTETSEEEKDMYLAECLGLDTNE